jgi:hypothetical protein
MYRLRIYDQDVTPSISYPGLRPSTSQDLISTDAMPDDEARGKKEELT